MGYHQRLARRAWGETVELWTAYRWWLSFASPIAAILILLGRKGWGAIVNASDVLINGAGGAAIAFLGTIVISICRAPKLLDDERKAEIEHRDAQIAAQVNSIDQLNRRLQKPLRTPAEQHRFDAAQASLQQIGEIGTTVLRHLITHGELTFGQFSPPLPSGMNVEDARSALNLCVKQNLATMTMVNKRVYYDYIYRIAPAMVSVLEELLYQDAASTP